MADFTWDPVTNDDTLNPLKGTSHNGTPGLQGLLHVDQIQVAGPDLLSCLDDPLDTKDCLPPKDDSTPSDKITTYDELINYVVGDQCSAGDDATSVKTGTDGWYRKFLIPRERNLGQASLLGGMLDFTTYVPFEDPCLSEGMSYLYSLYYQTGTPWYESVFGDPPGGAIKASKELGLGLSTTPNLYVGKMQGAKAFVQTSTGAIVGVKQPNLPFSNYKSGRASWEELDN
ncbi:MAG: hypothetical protein P8Y63_13045 [Deltaproteobacteria bacterium]